MGVEVEKYDNNEVVCLSVPNRIKGYFGSGHEDRTLYIVEGVGYIIKTENKKGVNYELFLAEDYAGTDLEGRIILKEISDEL